MLYDYNLKASHDKTSSISRFFECHYQMQHPAMRNTFIAGTRQQGFFQKPLLYKIPFT